MYGAPYKMYGASYILYVAANTCMVRAVLYCTVLRAFSHFHAIYRCFPYNSARNSYFPLHLCAGPVGDSGAQINQPTGALVQTSTSVGTLDIWRTRYSSSYLFHAHWIYVCIRLRSRRQRCVLRRCGQVCEAVQPRPGATVSRMPISILPPSSSVEAFRHL